MLFLFVCFIKFCKIVIKSELVGLVEDFDFFEIPMKNIMGMCFQNPHSAGK